jgi:hypothetical protein
MKLAELSTYFVVFVIRQKILAGRAHKYFFTTKRFLVKKSLKKDTENLRKSAEGNPQDFIPYF